MLIVSVVMIDLGAGLGGWARWGVRREFRRAPAGRCGWLGTCCWVQDVAVALSVAERKRIVRTERFDNVLTDNLLMI